MISVEEAITRVTAPVRPVGAEVVALSEALGRVLAEDVAARLSHPPSDVSAMDGYAVRSADVATVPVALPVVGASAAGHPWDGVLAPGQALRIFTGAAVPGGADAVVMQEDTDADAGTVTIKLAVPHGHHIRKAGGDFAAGVIGLTRGRRLTHRDVALAAAMNVPWLHVHRRPRVAILSTGDEIRLPGEALPPGAIPGSNAFGLAGFVTELGGSPIDLGVAGDSRESLLARAEATRGADVIVTSGGVSVGEHDLLKTVWEEIGLSVDFWKVSMKPGKPLMFGHLGDTPVLGLPGNPVSAMVAATLFLQPMLRVMQGLPAQGPLTARGRLTAALGPNGGRQDYMRATLARDDDGTLLVSPLPVQDSGRIADLARADCLAVRPPNAPAAAAGDSVTVVMLI